MLPKRLFITANALLAITSAVLAQPSSSDCRTSLEALRSVIAPISETVSLPSLARWSGGWCVGFGASVALDESDGLRLEIDKLSWRASDLEAAVTGGTMPADLDVLAEGVRLTARDLQASRYINQYPVLRKDAVLGLSLARGEDDGTLRLRQVQADFADGSSIAMVGTIEGANLASPAALLLSAGTMALTSLSVEVHSNGVFEGYLPMPPGNDIMDGERTVSAQLTVFRAKAEALVAALPETILPARAWQDAQRFVSDIENPRGHIRIGMVSDSGFGLQQILRIASAPAPENPADVVPFLQGMRFDFAYDPDRFAER